MNKKDEALKLALEAMTYADACLKKQLTTKDKHQYAQDLLLEAGTAIREALAEQPAQQQEPYGQVTVVRRPGCVDQHWFYRWPEPPYLDNAAECHTVYTSPQPAQQQEPVAYASDVEFDDETEIIPAEQKGRLGTAGLRIPLYTSPPASKPWEGLSDKEIKSFIPRDIAWEYEIGFDETIKFARAIEAKLREKNNG